MAKRNPLMRRAYVRRLATLLINVTRLWEEGRISEDEFVHDLTRIHAALGRELKRKEPERSS